MHIHIHQAEAEALRMRAWELVKNPFHCQDSQQKFSPTF